MEKKQPLDNRELSSMIITGALLTLIGLVIWLANTDFDTSPGPYGYGSDESGPAGQFLGAGIGLLGFLLLSLGWASTAICRQITDSRQTQRGPES